MLKDVFKFFLAALSGLMLVASFPNDLAYVPTIPMLAWIAAVPLLGASSLAARPREAFLLGYFSGVISYSAVLYWLISFGPLPVLLIALSYSLFTGMAALFAWFMLRRISPLAWWWVYPSGAAAIWFAKSTGLWGFPWVIPAHALANNPVFIQAADIGGVPLVGFLTAAVSITLYQALFNRGDLRIKLRSIAICAAIFALNFGYGMWRLGFSPQGDPVVAGLVQGGVESDVQWTENYNRMVVDVYSDATERFDSEGGVDFFVWPESAIGSVAARTSQFSLPVRVRTLPRILNTPLLMGVTTFDGKSLFNSALLVQEDGSYGGFSDKSILIPFGEVLPFGKFVRMLPFPWGDYDIDRGNSLSLISVPIERDAGTDFVRVATAICFDSIKPFVLRSQAERGANLIVIVTNNSWYKLPSGTQQHAMLDAFRAVENRRWTLRCSTTGVSHVIDPAGRILESTGQLTSGYIRAQAELIDYETPYTKFGDLFGWLVMLAGIVIFAWMLALGEVENFL